MNKQLTEDYVSFETAKLLKEKGFNENTSVNYFIGDDKLRGCIEGEMIHHKRLDTDTHLIACPTLQMAMKWLRDVHKKVINVEYIDFLEHGEVWSYSILDRNTFHEFTESFTEHSYEEACEAAIKYCLENLI